MKSKKALFLFLALLLPVCIFIFLKIFGKNQFDVPVLFQSSVPDTSDCNTTYHAPYKVQESVLKDLFNDSRNDLVLVNFSTDTSFTPRVKDEVAGNDVKIIQVSNTALPSMDLKFVRNCVLLMKAPLDLALVDRKGQIRGQYISNDREEIDRLIVELKIILRKY